MVSDNILWYTETSNDLVEYKVSFCFVVNFEGTHCLWPICVVVYNDNDIFVPPSKKWISHQVIYPTLGEGPHHDDGKQRSRMQLHFSGVEPTWVIALHSFHTIFEDHGPKITGLKNIMGHC